MCIVFPLCTLGAQGYYEEHDRKWAICQETKKKNRMGGKRNRERETRRKASEQA